MDKGKRLSNELLDWIRDTSDPTAESTSPEEKDKTPAEKKPEDSATGSLKRDASERVESKSANKKEATPSTMHPSSSTIQPVGAFLIAFTVLAAIIILGGLILNFVR